MRAVDLIVHKRDGGELSRDQIAGFVNGVVSRSIPDYQAAALLMAIVLRGMSDAETVALTDAMARSGARVDLSDVPGIKVGKHSTGGVGDKISLVLGPVAAACGLVVPKMSGRGLGHTGGTIDKLESIPGCRADLSIDRFKQVLRTVGVSIVSQSAELAPADKILYALRDVTGTVDSIPLIAASVMSKKLVEGTDALVLDVKCGHGAFTRTEPDARALARVMVSIGRAAGIRTAAVVTAMDTPLGRAVGNALEVREAIATLAGRGPADVVEEVVELAGQMCLAGGVESDAATARRRASDALSSGRALVVFARMVEAQGGDARVVDDPALLPVAAHVTPVRAPRTGFVVSLDALAIGDASRALGAGRVVAGAAIDPSAGIVLHATRGDAVQHGALLAELHHGRPVPADECAARVAAAFRIGDAAPPPAPVIKALIT